MSSVLILDVLRHYLNAIHQNKVPTRKGKRNYFQVYKGF